MAAFGVAASVANAAGNPYSNDSHGNDSNGRHYQTQVDNRYNHNHSYPVHGYVTAALPYGYANVHYHGSPYYYGGRRLVSAVRTALRGWLRRRLASASGFLPPYYTTVWFGGSPYYYADQTYYQWYPDRRQYVVTQPPVEQHAEVGPAPCQQRGNLRVSQERPERGAAVNRSLRMPRLGRAAERLRSHASERWCGGERY